MLNQRSIEHLMKDRKLKKVIETVGELSVKKDTDLYLSLLRGIVGQQLSVKAAQTIWQRFLSIFEGMYPSPDLLLSTDAETFRRVGLSYQKATYLVNIAGFAKEKSLDYKELNKMKDEDLIEYLVQIKGVGRWTVEMILMFNLGREDVFPKADLGIQTGMRIVYGLDEQDKRAMTASMEKISKKWIPYRSLACMYIWKIKDTTVAQSRNKKQKPEL